MKERVYNFLLYFSILILLMIIFNLLLYLTCSFDSKLLKDNIDESYDTLNEQGMFYKLSHTFNIFNNNCTDAVIINESYSIDKNHPFFSYMKARKNYNPNITEFELDETNGEGVSVNYDESLGIEMVDYNYDPVTELGNFIAGKLHYSINYGRYWHGYLILFRPLLLLFNITQIRYLLLLSFSILGTFFIYLIYKMFGKNVAIIFAMSLICSGYFSASYSLESSPVFLTMIIGSIFLLKRINKIKKFGIYIFVLGCITNYVDYLTVPLITLGIPCFIYLLKLVNEKKDWKYCIKFVIINFFIWFLGYGGTWISKWIIYDLFVGGNISMIQIGVTQSFYRMQRLNTNVTSEGCIPTIINIISNSSMYVLATIMILLFINKSNEYVTRFKKTIFSFLTLAFLTIVWYAILANHTIMHYYFTYRQSLVFMIGVLLSINISFFSNNDFK